MNSSLPCLTDSVGALFPHLEPLILGSASPRRLDLLQRLGVTPHAVLSANIHEIWDQKERPGAHAVRMAHEKARHLASLYGMETQGPIEVPPPSSIAPLTTPFLLLTADTVVALGRRVLPKAKNAQDVAQCLQLLSGRRHTVYTAVQLVRIIPGTDSTAASSHWFRPRLVSSVIRMKMLQPREIHTYASLGEGIGKAGGYAIQGAAEAWVVWMSGSHSAVIGLPLHETYQLLTTASTGEAFNHYMYDSEDGYIAWEMIGDPNRALLSTEEVLKKLE